MKIDPQAEINFQWKRWFKFAGVTVLLFPFANMLILKSFYINKIIFSETIASAVYYYSSWTKVLWEWSPSFNSIEFLSFQSILSVGIVLGTLFCLGRAGSAWNSIQYWEQVRKEALHNANVKNSIKALNPDDEDDRRKIIQIIENNRQGHTYIQKNES
jgi:hypothetical protein